jgi:ArsR family transcriptional regulator, arsenate/arsenite/antimonite-responsive transcriptional repressor
MDHLFKTLGDTNRLRIVNLLRQRKLCVCEIEVILNTTQSNVSRHLSRLRNEKIITFEKHAQWIYYSIDQDFLDVHDLLFQYLEHRMNLETIYQEDIKHLQDYVRSGESCETLKNNEKAVAIS